MRCPHCASPLAEPPTCVVCGVAFDAPATELAVPELEPTRVPTPIGDQVPVLPGLVSTQEAGPGHEHGAGIALPYVPAGIERSLAEPGGMAGEEARTATHCPNCEAPIGDGRFCESCGLAYPRVYANRDEAPPEGRVCSECGVVNTGSRPLCAGCGRRI